MCGIFAMLLNRPLTPADIEQGRLATAMMVHRGPDGEGEWIDTAAGVYFGHRRLSIIDLTSASAQPMRLDGYALSYNGEIYNHRALRKVLEDSGEQFISNGDTEVLLRAWRRWGESALDRVDGMFAFVIWDGEAAHLAVDPFGEKPLYWAKTDDGVIISSELDPLVEVTGAEPALTGDDLIAYLALGYLPAPRTAFKDVRCLEPASVMTVRSGRPEGVRRYWTAPMGEPGRAAPRVLVDAELDRIEHSMVASLADRIQADVPVCLFLSSGVDSSLVAALAGNVLDTKPECITVSFSRGCVDNESEGAAAIARHLGLAHRIIESDESRDNAGVEEALSLFGQPNDNVTVLSIHQIARAAAQHYKVALTGMGGDEVFFGYGKHVHYYNRRHIYGLNESIRLGLGALSRRAGRFHPRLKSFAELFGRRDCDLYLSHNNYPAIGWLHLLPGWRQWAEATFGKWRRPLELAVPRFEMGTVMPSSRLVALDHGSMRASLELRTPFLCRQVVETTAEFDPRAFLAFGQKSVLRRLLARHLPQQLIDKAKRGFVFPQNRLLQGYGNAVPSLPGLPQNIVETAWLRRADNPGARRIAVRLAILDRFANQSRSRGKHKLMGEAPA